MRDNERDALVALAEVLPPKPLPNMDYSYEVSPAHARELHSRFDRLMEALAAPADCVGCEGAPAEGNNPCAVCGRGDPPAASVDVQTIALIANMAAYIRAEGGENAGALLSHADKLIDSAGGAKENDNGA